MKVVVEAVKLRKTRFRKSRQAAAAEDVIERQIVPRLDTHSLSRSHIRATTHHRILATRSPFLCKLWLHVSMTPGGRIGMIALDASHDFSFLIIDNCDSWQGGRVARAPQKRGKPSHEEMLAFAD